MLILSQLFRIHTLTFTPPVSYRVRYEKFPELLHCLDMQDMLFNQLFSIVSQDILVDQNILDIILNVNNRILKTRIGKIKNGWS